MKITIRKTLFSLALLPVSIGAYGSDPAPFPDGVSEVCELPETSLSQQEGTDLVAAFKDYAMEQGTGFAQEQILAATNEFIIKPAAAAGDSAPYLIKTKPALAKSAGSWVHVYKAASIAKAIAAGDGTALVDMAVTEAAEKGVEVFLHYATESLAGAGTTFNPAYAGLAAGFIVAAAKTTYESYNELEKQDCLLNLDIGYYNLLEDPQLRFKSEEKMPGGAVDHFVRSYIVGAGEDREKHRRTLQCYINMNMPESERIQISTKDASGEHGGLSGFFSQETAQRQEVLNSVEAVHGEKKNALRTTVNVMLRDMNQRKDIEENREKVATFLRSEEYKALMKLAKSMELVSLTNAWLCERLNTDINEAFIGHWGGMLRFTKPLTADGESYDDWKLDFSVNKAGQVAGEAWMFDPLEAEEDRFTMNISAGTVKGDRITFSVKDSYITDTPNGEQSVEDVFNFSGSLSANNAITGSLSGAALDAECDYDNTMAGIGDAVSEVVDGLSTLPAVGDGLSLDRTPTKQLNKTALEQCRYLVVEGTWEGKKQND